MCYVLFPTPLHRYCIGEFQHYTIAAIAFEVGFNSLSVFNQHFKSRMGITPSVYRKTAAGSTKP